MKIRYDGLQVRLDLQTEGGVITDTEPDGQSSLSIALTMLPNMFDNVRTEVKNGILTASLDADI